MIRYTILLSLFVPLSFSVGQSQTAAEEKQPTYVCRTATGPIEIDGQLDESAWKDAQVVSLRYPFRPATETNLPKTTARLLWDKNSIYLAWQAEDIDIWSYSDKNDDVLWKGDIVELFLKPSKTDSLFYEINIVPNGAIYDGRYPSRGAGSYHRFKKWNSQARIATHLDGTDDNWHDKDKGYTVEAAIPLQAFSVSGIPKAGDFWAFGLFRCEYSRNLDEPLLFSSVPEKLDPIHGFHSYELYQPIRFEDSLRTKK